MVAGAVLLTASSCALPGAEQPSAAATQAAATAAATPGTAVTPFLPDPGSTAGPAAAALPEAKFANPDYYAMPGQTINFDVSESLPRGVNIAQYEWDFDGDGGIDQAGPIPVATHSYPAAFEGTATVRITHAAGGLSTASTGVHIGRGPRDGLPVAPVNVSVLVTAHSDGISIVQVSWEPGGLEPYRWGVAVDGIPAGVVEGKARTATITDVRRTRDLEIGVVGFTENQAMGTLASVILPALSE
ncbi:hypothetical protein NicSoilB4_33570 [Arthrobacter sp. NicSoilB4]|nr:hypothetical protein NicSoilB4_33570 [Arthrobacter sp. NicSoilB4]